MISRRGIKIADFGLSRVLSDSEKSLPSQYQQDCQSTGHTTTFVGTLAYMSPERILGAAYNHSSDIYSLGKIVVATALGESPPSCSYWTKLSALTCESREDCFQMSQNWSKAFLDFVSICLTYDTDSRSSAGELLEHEFLQCHSKYTVDTCFPFFNSPEPMKSREEIITALNQALLTYRHEESQVHIERQISLCLELINSISFE